MIKISDKLIIIKYGTAVLMRHNESGEHVIDHKTMKEHGQIINEVKQPIIMISSGAVGFGRSMMNFDYIEDVILRKRAQAAVGNPYLSRGWDSYIFNKRVLQGLVTHRELKNKTSQEELEKLIHSVYQKSDSAVIQFNENDLISDEELKEVRGGDFGDNDVTTTMIAELCSHIFTAVTIVINTMTDGVLDSAGQTITSLNTRSLDNSQIDVLCGDTVSSVGTGGMRNKLIALRDLSSSHHNIISYIVNGKKPDQLKSFLGGNKVGTKIYYS